MIDNPFKVSTDLRAVLAGWLAMSNNPNPSYEVMRYGLCHYTREHSEAWETAEELSALFYSLKLDSACPFDCAGVDYFNEKDKHKNPARRAFVELVLAMNPVGAE